MNLDLHVHTDISDGAPIGTIVGWINVLRKQYNVGGLVLTEHDKFVNDANKIVDDTDLLELYERLAEEFIKNYNIPFSIGSSDAHLASELAKYSTHFEEEIPIEELRHFTIEQLITLLKNGKCWSIELAEAKDFN